MKIKNYLSKKFAIFALAGGMAIPALANSANENKQDSDQQNIKNKIELTAHSFAAANDTTATDTTTTQQNNTTASAAAPATPYEEMSIVFAQIMFQTAQGAVTNPDMSVYGVKAVQYMLDSIATKYGVQVEIPDEFHQYNAQVQATKDNDPTNDNTRDEVLKEIMPSVQLFQRMQALASLPGLSEKDLAGIAGYAVDKMLHEIDPHADYFTPEEWTASQNRMSGNAKYGGFGFTFGKDTKTGYIRIRPYENTPAAKAGLQEFDMITHVNGTAVDTMDAKQFSEAMKGKIGEASTLTILRGTQQFDVTMTREEIKSPNVTHKILDDDTGYIRMNIFSQGAAQEVEDAIKQLKQEAADKGIELSGFVYDLRNNGGGRLGEALQIADLFLESGDIVAIKTSEGIVEEYKATKGSAIGDKPLVVLTNGYSASASELVTSALADNNRATVIGLNTFGKGTGQSVLPLSYGHGFKVTTFHYLPPSGSLQNKGVAPHIKVMPSDTVKFRTEADYGNSLANPNATQTRRETEKMAEFNRAADFSKLSWKYKQLSGDPDADLLSAVEYLNKLTNDNNGTNYMKFGPYVPPMKTITPKPAPKLGA